MIVHILSLNDDDDDAKALPTGVLKDDAMKKGGWGVKMSPKVMASYLYVPLLGFTGTYLASMCLTGPYKAILGLTRIRY